jgi:hypothetical protein
MDIIQQAQQWAEEKKRQGWKREDFLREMGKMMNVDQDLKADLIDVATYAVAIADELQKGKPPTLGYVNRMAELAEKVQRSLDPNYEEWCNAQSQA